MKVGVDERGDQIGPHKFEDAEGYTVDLRTERGDRPAVLVFHRSAIRT
jgi:hypothetical protein